MDFARYLLYTRRLTRWEYEDLTADQRVWGLGPLELLPPHGFVITHLNEIWDLESIRERPFGEILEESAIGGDVLGRAGKSLGELIEEWQEWHCEQLEPICMYSMTSNFGQQLYRQQVEKKLVARHVANKESRPGQKIIGPDERVVIPEGTSGLYVGLALAAVRRNVVVHTSNSGLIREYRDNPAVARGLGTLHVIGGEADFDRHLQRSDYGAVYGAACHEQYRKAFSENPPATIVIMTVSGMTADAGPAVCGPTGTIKADIIRQSLASGVREVIFVADYTKHLPRRGRYAGVPIFPPGEWREITERHRERIRIVTAPPPALRMALALEQGRDVRGRNLADVHGPEPFSREDYEYDRVAKGLYNLAGINTGRGGQVHSMYQEVYEPVGDRTVCSFVVDRPREEFPEHEFLAELARLAHLDASKLSLRSEDRDRKTLVVVGGPLELRGAVESRCEFESNDIADFRDRTRTTTIRVTKDGRSHSFELNRLPTRG